MSARDRHRRPQLVRDVVKELLLPLEQRRALLGLTPRPSASGVLAPARVPDHREEHRRHERHLEELAPLLVAAERVVHDQERRSKPRTTARTKPSAEAPDPEAVEQRQADPDEVERDRLPARPQGHRGEVGERERDPARSRAELGRSEAGSPHGERSRSARPRRASCAGGARRRRRRSSRDRSGSPRPPTSRRSRLTIVARVLDEVMQEAELAVREVGDELADPRLPTREVERERPGADEARRRAWSRARAAGRARRATSSSSANGFAR